MKLRCFARAGSLLLALTLLCATTGARAAEDTPEGTRAYNTAVGVHNSEDYELAAKLWVKFTEDFKADSRVPKAWHYLGVCYFKLNKLGEAAKTFEKVINEFPGYERLADTYLNLGLAQYDIAHSGNAAMYDTAAQTFNTLAAKYPDGKHVAEAIFYQGECLYNRGKKKEAAEKYGQVVAKYPTHAIMAQAMFALGVTRADLEQHKEALETYAAFLKKFPQSPLVTEATMWQGESLYALKRYAEAAKAYAAAAAKKGFRMADHATVRQADALSALKQHAEAAALYASVPVKFKKSPYIVPCNLEAGKNYYLAGDLAKAQEFLGKVIAAGGNSAPEAAHWAAQSLLKQQKPAEALAVVEKILPASGEGPHKVSLLMDQADAIYEIPARRGESVALYAALAAKYPNDRIAPQALYMAALAAMNLGDYKAALRYAESFLTAHTGHELAVGVMHVKAQSLLLSEKFAEAEKLYDELLAKAPSDRDVRLWKVQRGTALYFQKKYQEAIAALQPLLAGIKTPELLAEARYRIGRSQAGLKQFDAAIKSLEASLAAAPKWKLADDTHLVLAYAYQQTKNLAKAKENARKVIAEIPHSKLLDMAHYRLGECARLGNDLKTAVSEYEQVIKAWPQTPLMRQTLYGLGWAQVGQEDYAGAEKTFSTLIAKYPGDKLIPRARYRRGVARRQLKNYAPAIEDIQAFLATNPALAEKSRARHVLGLCQKGLKQFDQAVATFRKLFEEDPNYDDAVNVYFELGWAEKSAKKESDAAKTFALLAEKFPDHSLAADSLYLVGDFECEKGDLEYGKKAYEEAKKAYKKAAVAYYAAMNKAGKTKLGEEAAYKLGWAYYRQDDFPGAQKTFNYQRRTWPNGPLVSDGAFMEAECFFKQQKYDQALATYELVKSPANKEVEVLTLLHSAQAAGLLKQWEKDLQLATKCIQQFPDSSHLPQALYEKGWAQQNLGKLEEATATYTEVIARSNKEPAAKAQFMIGEIQFQQRKHAEAIVSYVTVVSNYGYPKWQAHALYEAGRCYEVLKKPRPARRQYERLIEKFPDSEHAPLAKQRLRDLKG